MSELSPGHQNNHVQMKANETQLTAPEYVL